MRKRDTYKFFKSSVITLLVFMAVSFLYAGGSHAAVMPDFTRLNPISNSAPTSVALDANEYVYVASSSSNKLYIYHQGGQSLKTLSGLSKPISVAVDGSGRIFVGSRNEGNVKVYNSNLEFQFKLGSGDGEFLKPSSIAIDSSDKIYVVDNDGDAVKVYNSDGTLDSSFGSSGDGDGEFNEPTAIAIDEAAGEIIVADRQSTSDSWGSLIAGARVQVFDMNGVFKRSFGEYGVGEGMIKMPLGVAVDADSRVYVSDSAQNVVHVFDSGTGTFLGTIYNMDNPLRTPLGVTAGSSNRLFIASLNTGTVEIYGLDSYTAMSVSPLSLSFEGEQGGSNPAVQSLTITNNGPDALAWTAETASGWITLSDGSGSLDSSASATVSVGINLSGLSVDTYTGTVIIRAGSGPAEIISVELTVAESTLVADACGPYSGTEGSAMTLDGSNSIGDISLYEWDVDNDGTYDYSTSSPTQSHTYASEGSYTLKLRVTDTTGNTDESTAAVEIADASPTADFTASETAGLITLAVTFTNNSSGYEEPLTYAWDFECDGIADSSDESPTHLYSAGVYDVCLTAADSDGSTNTLTKTNYVKVESLGGCFSLPIRKNGAFFSSLNTAYNEAGNGEVIDMRASTLSENLTFDRDITITLKGGFDCEYINNSGESTISGTVVISNGTVIIDDGTVVF